MLIVITGWSPLAAFQGWRLVREERTGLASFPSHDIDAAADLHRAVRSGAERGAAGGEVRRPKCAESAYGKKSA